MFFCAAMMSHSCSPNTAWHLDDASSFILQARRPIAAGEEITISYLSPADLCLPTADRREILQVSKGFRCCCERCFSVLDGARGFRCPRCAGFDAFASEATDESFGGSAPSRLVCRSCGPLSEVEGQPLLEAEGMLKPWARSLPEFHAISSQEPFRSDGSSPDEQLRRAEALGLSPSHWILDAALGEVLRTLPDSDQARACELLRRRLEATRSEHCATKQARLRLALGEALRRHDPTPGGLQEAAAEFEAAAEVLALLFGSSHREHQEAVAKRDKVLRQLRGSSGGKEVQAWRGAIGRVIRAVPSAVYRIMRTAPCP